MVDSRSLKCFAQDGLVLIQHAFHIQQRQHAGPCLAGEPLPQCAVDVEPEHGDAE